ncbi:hypothetical protein KH5_06220 [Urechidicola sp. KH5]
MKLIGVQLLFLLFYHLGLAQTHSELIEMIDSLYLETNVHLIFPNKEGKIDIISAQNIDTISNTNYYQIKLKELRAKQFNQDVGLTIKAVTNYNFEDAFDEEANVFNKVRIKGLIEWDLMREGFFQNKNKAKISLNEAESLKIDQELNAKKHWREKFRIEWNYTVNQEEIKLLQEYLEFEKSYFDILHELYSEKLIEKEKLLTTANEIIVLENKIKLLSQENKVLKDEISTEYKYETLPLIKLIIDSISPNNEFSLRTSLDKKNIDLKYKLTNDLKLSIYMGQNFNHSLTRNQFYPSVGFRFEAPLRFNQKNQIKETEMAILEMKQTDDKTQIQNNFITQIKSYRDKISAIQIQYHNWELINEHIRTSALLKNHFYKETGIIALQYCEEKFKILLQLIQLKRQLYSTISNLFILLPNYQFSELIEPFHFNSEKHYTPVIIQKNKDFSLEFQYQYSLAKKNLILLVARNDHETQNFLNEKHVSFELIESQEDYTSICELISKDLKKMKYEKILISKK